MRRAEASPAPHPAPLLHHPLPGCFPCSQNRALLLPATSSGPCLLCCVDSEHTRVRLQLKHTCSCPQSPAPPAGPARQEDRRQRRHLVDACEALLSGSSSTRSKSPPKAAHQNTGVHVSAPSRRYDRAELAFPMWGRREKNGQCHCALEAHRHATALSWYQQQTLRAPID